MSDKIPDPSASCPRCHHFAQSEVKRDDKRKAYVSAWPLGINQVAAQDILTRAFPQKGRR